MTVKKTATKKAPAKKPAAKKPAAKKETPVERDIRKRQTTPPMTPKVIPDAAYSTLGSLERQFEVARAAMLHMKAAFVPASITLTSPTEKPRRDLLGDDETAPLPIAPPVEQFDGAVLKAYLAELALQDRGYNSIMEAAMKNGFNADALATVAKLAVFDDATKRAVAAYILATL